MSQEGKSDDFAWEPQVTVPMPLEALYSLMTEQKREAVTKNVLTGTPGSIFKEPLALVTKNYFLAKPNGIDSANLSEDVLGFASLVLSYAKLAYDSRGAHYLHPGSSPKLMTTFMPRTDFNTMFGMVKDKMPNDLFKL